jgi:hypothetical protein
VEQGIVVQDVGASEVVELASKKMQTVEGVRVAGAVESREEPVGGDYSSQESNYISNISNISSSNSNISSEGNGGRMDNCEIRVFDVCESGFWARPPDPHPELVLSLPSPAPPSLASAPAPTSEARDATKITTAFTFPSPSSIIASCPADACMEGADYGPDSPQLGSLESSIRSEAY